MKKSAKLSLTSLTLISLSAAIILVSKLVFAAGTASLSLTPASGTFAQGDTVSVAIYEDSGSDTVNAVQANFSYPSNLLSFTGITNSSAFGVDAQSTISGGTVHLARGALTAVSGNQLVATVRFTAIAGGTSNLSFISGSTVVRSNDNGAETLTTNDASYDIISPATLTLSPATKTFNKGDAVTVSVYENSGGTPVNAVQANLSYSNTLTFVSIDDASTSAFPINAQSTGGNGSVKIGRGTTTPVTGNQLIGTIHFTASSAGSAVLTFVSGSDVIRSADNGSESLTNTGANYTISAPSSSGSSSGGGSASKSTPKSSGSSGGTTSSPSPSSTPSDQPPVTTNVDKTPPVISQIKATNLSLKTATITWQTSEPATSEVDFGLTTKYVLSATDTKLTKNHSISLNSRDLLPRTTYHFVVKSVDAAGNLVASKDITFRTEPVSAKSSSAFWAAFAAFVILGAGAWVAYNYIRRRPPPSAGNSGGDSGEPMISGDTGGTVVTPGSSASVTTSPDAVVINPSGPPPPEEIVPATPPNIQPAKQ